MIRIRFVASIVAVGCLVALTARDTFAQAGMAESSIRRIATHKPLPSYPGTSVAKGTSGVAVAAIVSGPGRCGDDRHHP